MGCCSGSRGGEAPSPRGRPETRPQDLPLHRSAGEDERADGLHVRGGAYRWDEISVEYSGLLVRRGGEVAAYAALFRALEGHWEGWRRFRITATAHGPHIASALHAGLHCYCVLSQPSCRVDLDRLRDSGKGYVDSLKRNFRHHLRQSLRAYKAHGPLKVEVADGVGLALAWLDELRTLHERRWRSKGKEGSFSSDFFHDFHQALVRKGTGDGYVRLTRVSAGALVVGYLYNLHWRGTVYFYNCGLNYGALPRYDSPGSAALAACIQHCLDEGLAAFDLGRSVIQSSHFLSVRSQDRSCRLIPRTDCS